LRRQRHAGSGRNAAESIIGNLDEDGYLSASLDEIAGAASTNSRMWKRPAVSAVARPAACGAQPARVHAAADRQHQRHRRVAWQIVSNHMRLLETRQYKEIAKLLGRPPEHVEIAVNMIHHLNLGPAALLRSRGARGRAGCHLHQGWRRLHHPDERRGRAQLRLNAQYRKMLDRDQGATKEVRDYVRERYTSAIQLMKNIEQRKQTSSRSARPSCAGRRSS